MKDKLTNESGAALVLVLLSIFIVMIFGAVLASQINSSGLQVKKAQHNVQAEALAVMGQEIFIESIRVLKPTENLKIGTYFERELDPQKEYVVELLSINTEDSDVKTLSYKSKGVSFGSEEVITGEISLNSSSDVSDDWQQEIIDQLPNVPSGIELSCDDKNPGKGNEEDCNINSEGDVYLKGSFISAGAKTSFVGGSFWVEGSIELKGGRSINVEGSAYFDQSSLSMNGNSGITINGDAYLDLNSLDVDGGPEIIIKGNALFINPERVTSLVDSFCIVGKTNLKDSNGNSVGGQSCP